MKVDIEQQGRLGSKVGVTFGLLTGVSIIVFWLLLRVSGLAEKLLDLRHIAVLILFFFTYKAISRISKLSGGPVGHFSGFGLSIFIAAIGYGLSSAFLFVYLQLDHTFMQFLHEHGPFGQFLTPLHVALWEVSEGLGMQVIFGLIVMELFKALNRKNESPKD